MKHDSVLLRAGARALACVMALVLGGCALRGSPTFGPEDIPRLERALAEAPEDVDARTQLGVAYYNAGRYEEARTQLTHALGSESASGAAFLYDGLSSEELEDWSAARAAYNRYIESGSSEKTKADLRRRLAIVARKELRQQARQAMATEAAISQEPPTPRSVAVFPFRIVGGSEELKPLEVALADMMITDLQLSRGLRLLERVQVQALLDEMVLAGAGYTTPESGARAGRMLRAEHVVQGVLTPVDGTEIRLDAAVLAAQRAEPHAELAGTGSLDALFDVEKKLVFDLLDALGVELTDAEREAINENRAANLLAFVAYGRGLQALDRGDYANAVAEFQQAAQLDPSFGAAQQQQVQATELQSATEMSTTDITQDAAMAEMPGAELPVATELASGTESLLRQTANETVATPAVTYTQTSGAQSSSTQSTTQSATNRNASSEGQGSEGVNRAATARITITIQRPKTGT